MTAKEIIMSMVDGLATPWTEICMATYGEIYGDVCYGCAATNAICQIKGELIDLTYKAESGINNRYLISDDDSFVEYFERAINHLRKGNIRMYNAFADVGQFAKISNTKNIYLETLNDDYSKEDLDCYKDLANHQ